MKRLFVSLAILMFFAGTGVVLAQDESSSRPFDVEKDSVYIPFEFRGAWLSTVESIDWPKVKIELSTKDKGRISSQREQQKKDLVSLITKIKRSGCNAVMFQIVSNSDALYPSKILQWAPSLTDIPGEGPGYDPLALAVKTAHSLGMEIHAWINPLRIGKLDLPRRQDNICYKKSELVQEHGGKLYWDPGQPKVREYLGSLAEEIMSKYDLDGLHIDDYFYPDGLKGTGEQAKPKKNEKVWNDEALFQKYGAGKTLDQWREGNIDEIVRIMHEKVHQTRPDAVFGVSPAGRLVNTQALYADPQGWAKQGTIDYLIPQIYWQHGHPIADFKKVLDSWSGILNDVPVIVGMAAYRFKSKAFPEFSEYVLQVEECRQAPFLDGPERQNVIGQCWFTTHNIITDEFTGQMINTFYKEDMLPPGFSAVKTMLNSPDVFRMGRHLRWSEVPGADSFAVYLLEANGTTPEGGIIWKAVLQEKFHGFIYKCRQPGNYLVLACKKGIHSERSNIIYIKDKD
jgi:uncharacterized lipoprotein YddW (UPF0748 family)